MERISSIPFPVSMAARAYGAPAPRGGNAAQITRTEPLARIGRLAEPRPASDPSRLVAARVDAIDLARDVAAVPGRPTGPGLPMYRHPADLNGAATAIALGRSLDVKG